MWIKEEVYDSKGKKFISTSMTLWFKNDASSTWHLTPGKHQLFGNAKPTPSKSIEVLTPSFVTSTTHLSHLVRVKVESHDPYRIFLSESYDDNVVELKRNPSLLFPILDKSFEVVFGGTAIQSLNSCQNSSGRATTTSPNRFCEFD